MGRSTLESQTSVRVDLAAVGAEGEGLDVVVHLDGERLLLRPRVQEVHVTESTLLCKLMVFTHLVALAFGFCPPSSSNESLHRVFYGNDPFIVRKVLYFKSGAI